MNITGVQQTNRSYAQKITGAQGEDSVIKNLQSQITELQKQLQQLSKDSSGDEQSLAEKRKEIQQQINDLNVQIRQRQVEIRKEKQQPKSGSAEQGGGQAGFSVSDASGLISTANILEQSKTVGGAIAKSEGRASILEAEIKTDKSRGVDTTYKEKELSKVNNSIDNAKEAQAKLTAESQQGLKTESKEEENKADKKTEDKRDEEDIKTEGKYDKEGRLTEETDPEKADYEDKA